MRRSLWLCLLISFFSLLVGCTSLAEPAAEPTPTPLPTAVKPTFTVQRGDIVIKTELGGRAVPVDSNPVSFATEGNVGNLYVQVGDRVEAGQLLADLEVLKDLETEWAKASAEAKYEETLSNNTIRRAEIKSQIAQLTLENLKARGASPAEIQIGELQAELAQMDLDELKANPALHTAAAKAKELEQAMADAQLKSPVAGVIIEAPTAGKAVRPTSPAFQIGDVSSVELGAAAMEEDLKQLTEGLPVSVVFEGRSDKQVYPGTIRQLPYPYGSGTDGAKDIRVTLDNPAAVTYKLGDRVLISTVLQQKKQVLWLPPQAIRTVGGKTFVIVQTPAGGQQRVDVMPGLQTSTRVEVLGNLTEGQVVVGP
jgi:macrolide-specific efflux system membrane fusion protein